MTSTRMDVPPGCIASVVTHLEMTQPSSVAPAPPAGCELRRAHRPSLDWYRDLFRKVGEEWLWFSRLVMDDVALRRIVEDPAVEIYVALEDGRGIGMVELDFRVDGACELVFFGVVVERIGRGSAAWMIAEALRLAWRPGVGRVWLHTCTLDHPAAVPFYEKHGFRAYRREIEIDPDPRLDGTVPRTAAPYHPVLR